MVSPHLFLISYFLFLMLSKMPKTAYTPIFTPRLRLSDSTVVGIEVGVRQNQSQRLLTSKELLQLILSGKAHDLLNSISRHIEKWRIEESHFYFTWEVMGNTTIKELDELLVFICRIFPPNRLEIVLNFDNMPMVESMIHLKSLATHLRNNNLRVCLYHHRLLELIPSELDGLIDSVKFKKGFIIEIRDDLLRSIQLRHLIEDFSKRKIEIIADDLYSKADVTCAILMGIAYGKGYYLSRNNSMRNPAKALKKKSGNDFYEKNMSFFQQLSLV